MNLVEGIQYLFDKDAVVIDTETTGFSKNDEVIDLAVVSLRSCQVIFNRQFIPTVKISPFATAKHGYDIYKLQKMNAIPLSNIKAQVELLFNDYPVIAYNKSFDNRLISQTFNKYGIKLGKANWHCAMQAYLKYKNLKSAKLEDACKDFNIQAGNHTALSDAIATRELLLKIKDVA